MLTVGGVRAAMFIREYRFHLLTSRRGGLLRLLHLESARGGSERGRRRCRWRRVLHRRGWDLCSAALRLLPRFLLSESCLRMARFPLPVSRKFPPPKRVRFPAKSAKFQKNGPSFPQKMPNSPQKGQVSFFKTRQVSQKSCWKLSLRATSRELPFINE